MNDHLGDVGDPTEIPAEELPVPDSVRVMPGGPRRRTPRGKEKIMTPEQCAAWLASRPQSGHVEARLAPPAPLGAPVARGAEFFW